MTCTHSPITSSSLTSLPSMCTMTIDCNIKCTKTSAHCVFHWGGDCRSCHRHTLCLLRSIHVGIRARTSPSRIRKARRSRKSLLLLTRNRGLHPSGRPRQTAASDTWKLILTHMEYNSRRRPTCRVDVPRLGLFSPMSPMWSASFGLALKIKRRVATTS